MDAEKNRVQQQRKGNGAAAPKEVAILNKKMKVLDPSKGRHYDHKLLITIIVLCCLGLIMVYSSSAYLALRSDGSEFSFVLKEAAFMAVGIVLMLVVSKCDYHWLKHVTWLFYWISLLLMFLVLTPLGVEVNGQKRWLNLIPGIKKTPTYQPTEIVKITLILLFAYLINKNYKKLDSIKNMLMMLGLLLLSTGFVIINNLSSGIIIAGIGALMFFMASKQKKLYWIVLILAIIVIAVVIHDPKILTALPFIEEYHLTRITAWLKPESDPRKYGYQILQGLYAIGSGGLFGRGLGNGIQKLGYVPEAYNDMIFAVICEELGIFGAACVMGLFAYMIYRFVHIIMQAPDLYGAMIVCGVMIHIGLQVLMNIAVATNSMPNTGVTLPFISYGGTSVMILLVEMGLVLSVSNQIIYEK